MINQMYQLISNALDLQISFDTSIAKHGNIHYPEIQEEVTNRMTECILNKTLSIKYFTKYFKWFEVHFTCMYLLLK